MPEPVGAETSAWAPAEIAGQAWTCAGVGSANARANHSRTCGVKGSRAGCTAGGRHLHCGCPAAQASHTAVTERNGAGPRQPACRRREPPDAASPRSTYNDRVRISRRRSRGRRTGRARAIIVLALVIACVPAASARAAEPDARTPSTLTADAAPAAVAFGGSAVLSGRLEGGGLPVAGATLTVDATTDGLVWSRRRRTGDGRRRRLLPAGHPRTGVGQHHVPRHLRRRRGPAAVGGRRRGRRRGGARRAVSPQGRRPRQPVQGLGRPASATSLRSAGRDDPLLRPRGGRVGRQGRRRRVRGDSR